MKPKVFRLGILFVTIISTVLIAEFIVRKINPQMTFSQAVKSSIDCYASDLNLPFTLGKNYTCTMTNVANEFHAQATLNSLGYRGKEFSIEKKSGETRILMVGDSMTFGWGLDDKDTYPIQLENILHGNGMRTTQVINGGYVGGLSPDSFYVYLKKKGIQLKPDLVVVNIFVWNDLSDFSESVWEKTDAQGLPEKVSSCCHIVDGRIFRNKSIDFQYKFPILRESHLFISLVKLLQTKFDLFKTPSLLAPKSETILGCVMNPECIYKFYPEEVKLQNVLSGIKKVADENNIHLLYVLLPVDVQLYKDSWGKYSRYGMQWFPKEGQEDFIQKRIGSFLTEKDIKYFDMYPYFNTHKNEGYPFFPIDAHFNVTGAQWAGTSLADYIVSHKNSLGLN